MGNVVPSAVTDILIHGKDSDAVERVLLPITRYGAVMNAPNLVTEEIETNGAPFHLLVTDTIIFTDDEIRKITGARFI
jgi:hypothetical protein